MKQMSNKNRRQSPSQRTQLVVWNKIRIVRIVWTVPQQEVQRRQNQASLILRDGYQNSEYCQCHYGSKVLLYCKNKNGKQTNERQINLSKRHSHTVAVSLRCLAKNRMSLFVVAAPVSFKCGDLHLIMRQEQQPATMKGGNAQDVKRFLSASKRKKTK